MSARASNLAALLRWLGPLTNERAVPPGVTRTRWVLREGALRGHRAHLKGVRADADAPSLLDAYVYSAWPSPSGVYVIAPGLHFAGPNDPRMDRFCRVIAASGFVVVAPFLPSFVDMKVAPSAVDDFERVVRASAERFVALGKPTIFSISFGSWPALEVAARLGDEVDGVITFGGYADFESVIRFSVSGVMHRRGARVTMPFDPLNLPAVFVNLLCFLPSGAPDALVGPLRELCYRTWGKYELKDRALLDPVIRARALGVDEAERARFLVCAGAEPGAIELVDRALVEGRQALVFASPSRALETMRCPVVVCHGRDDDVIPWGEAEKLHEALRERVPTRLLLTGLYAHTGRGRPRLRELASEVRTLLDIAQVLANGGRLRALLGG